MSNFREMAVRKIFSISNYFREMFKFLDFMNTLRNFEKYVFARIFEKFKYLAKTISINRISRSLALK